MSGFENMLAIALAFFVVTISPGPANIAVATVSMHSGRRAGLVFGLGLSIGLAVWGTLVVSLVDNIVRPYLIGKETRLPILWLFLAIVGGLKLFGFLGILVGPITLAVAAACYRIYMDTRRAAA